MRSIFLGLGNILMLCDRTQNIILMTTVPFKAQQLVKSNIFSQFSAIVTKETKQACCKWALEDVTIQVC